jgi:AraC family transcriptional regulator of adaptative response/methylated-DNA-[protein]-cysteine methyltransferase
MELTKQVMYNALLRKDRTFEGIFWVGVKTTGIFCRPTCTARKPKKENVVFFTSCSDAMRYGFRPCKVCSPLEREGETPVWIQNILDELRKDPFRRFKDYDLRKRGIEPSKLRRWFKKYHDITFHGYQRMLRINDAFRQIKNG